MNYGAQVFLVVAVSVTFTISLVVVSRREFVMTGTRRIVQVTGVLVALVGMYAFWPLPETPAWEEPATEQERKARDFAHSIVLPDSVPKPVPFNFALARFKALVPGMPNVSEQYFKHLCDTEAGQYIFKTMENVDGFLQMRPHRRYKEIELMDPFLIESAVGLSGDAGQVYSAPFPNVHYGGPIYFIQPMLGHYLWLDQPANDRPTYIHFYRDLSAMTFPKDGKEYVTGLNSRTARVPFLIAQQEKVKSDARLGYTYRGIRRKDDRNSRIAGGEMIILDLQSGEVLAVYREFKWMHGKIPRLDLSRWCGRPNSPDFDHLFIQKVLKPKSNINQT